VKIKINSQEYVYWKNLGLGLNHRIEIVFLAQRTDTVHGVFSVKALHIFHKLIRERKPAGIQNFPFLG